MVQRDRDQVHHIPDLIPMNTEDHATTPPMVPVVSYNNSNDDYIGAPQVSEVDPLGDYGPPARPIPPGPPPQQ